MSDSEGLEGTEEQVREFQSKQLRESKSTGQGNKALAELERDNKRLRDKLGEMTFLLIFTAVMLIDVLLFEKFRESTTIIVVFAIFQGICFIVMAPRFGIEEVGTLVKQLIGAWGRKNGNDK